VTKDGSNARKKAARELAAVEQIPYTEALRRIDQRAARTPPASEENTVTASAARVTRARVTPPVAALTTDVVLIGHTGRVDSVAFHPDGRTLATGGDVTVRLWDLATRQTTTALTSEARVVSVAFSPDGSILAAADTDGTVSLWTIATGQVTALPGSPDRVQVVAFSPDGRTLASSETHLEHHGQGLPVALGPDGRPSLAATQTQLEQRGPVPSGVHTTTTATVRLWDLATGQATATLFGHTEHVWSVAFSPDGHTLATGCMDNTVRLWALG
jgi:WD40 repeat protein